MGAFLRGCAWAVYLLAFVLSLGDADAAAAYLVGGGCFLLLINLRDELIERTGGE